MDGSSVNSTQCAESILSVGAELAVAKLLVGGGGSESMWFRVIGGLRNGRLVVCCDGSSGLRVNLM